MRALQAVGLVGAAYYLGRQIAPHWSEIRARPLAWQLGPLLLGSVIVVLNLYLLVGAWTASLRWCAERVAALDAAKIWFTANLARFLPGGVWQFASLAVMSSRYGVRPAAATATVLLEQIVLLLTGLAVVAAFTPLVLHAGWWQAALIVALLLGVVMLLAPRLGRRFLPSLSLVWSQLRAPLQALSRGARLSRARNASRRTRICWRWASYRCLSSSCRCPCSQGSGSRRRTAISIRARTLSIRGSRRSGTRRAAFRSGIR